MFFFSFSLRSQFFITQIASWAAAAATAAPSHQMIFPTSCVSEHTQPSSPNMMDCHSTMKRYQLKINSYQRRRRRATSWLLAGTVTQQQQQPARYQLRSIALSSRLARIDYFRFEKLLPSLNYQTLAATDITVHSIEYVIIVYGKSEEARWFATLSEGLPTCSCHLSPSLVWSMLSEKSTLQSVLLENGISLLRFFCCSYCDAMIFFVAAAVEVIKIILQETMPHNSTLAKWRQTSQLTFLL